MEYLRVLRDLVDAGTVDFEGETVSAHASLDRPAGARLALGLAAGGPAMLRVAASLADVVVTNMVGQKLLSTRTMPVVTAAALEAGRNPPRVAVAFSICATDRPALARDHVDRVLENYAAIPEYRVLLEAEGVPSPGHLALVGPEEVLRRLLADLAALGVTDLVASVKAPTPEEHARTLHFLAEAASAQTS
jgi:5,10-methylenetetrahydromethanopterin reductase